MRYALFWRPRSSPHYNLAEFEAENFNEALSIARSKLADKNALVGYLIAEILVVEVRPYQKYVALMDEDDKT